MFAEEGTVVSITLSNFKNPITEHLNPEDEGFDVQLYAIEDGLEYAVADTGVGIEVSGIN